LATAIAAVVAAKAFAASNYGSKPRLRQLKAAAAAAGGGCNKLCGRDSCRPIKDWNLV